MPFPSMFPASRRRPYPYRAPTQLSGYPMRSRCLWGLVTSGDAASVSVVVCGVTAGLALATAAFSFSAGGISDFTSGAGAAAFTATGIGVVSVAAAGSSRSGFPGVGVSRLFIADQRRQAFR